MAQYEHTFDMQDVGAYPNGAQAQFGFVATSITIVCIEGTCWTLVLGADAGHSDDIFYTMNKLTPTGAGTSYKVQRATDRLWLRKLRGPVTGPLRVTITARDS